MMSDVNTKSDVDRAMTAVSAVLMSLVGIACKDGTLRGVIENVPECQGLNHDFVEIAVLDFARACGLESRLAPEQQKMAGSELARDRSRRRKW
jgi:hypothetical protein